MRTVYSILFLTILIISCRKNTDVLLPQQHNKQERIPQSCDFGQQDFNTIKRAYIQEEMMSPDVPESGTPVAVLLLDFDGHTVSNTPWNHNGDIICSPANLSPNEINEIINRVTEDFSAFEIDVTTNESLYNQCSPNRRMRVIITETWEWYGQTGGVAFINSFTWGNNTPCFVFSSLLNYVPKKISEATSHEAGHTFGLLHQSSYDPGCFLLSEYCTGQGIGEISWAPIMGVGYNRNMTTWRRGANIYGCNSVQDDINIISSILQFKVDDHSSQFNQATRVTTGSATGRINSSSDIDLFMIDRQSTCTVTITPFSVSGNNEGANLDIKIKVYSRNRNLVATINDPLSLSAFAVLLSGKMYISVETTENINAEQYGQLGNYTLSIN